MAFDGLLEHGFDPEDLNKVKGTTYWGAIREELSGKFPDLSCKVQGQLSGKWLQIHLEEPQDQPYKIAKIALLLDKQDKEFLLGIHVEKSSTEDEDDEKVFDEQTWDWAFFREFLMNKRDAVLNNLRGWKIKAVSKRKEIFRSSVEGDDLSELADFMKEAIANPDWVGLYIYDSISVEDAVSMGGDFVKWVAERVKKAKPVLKAFYEFKSKKQGGTEMDLERIIELIEQERKDPTSETWSIERSTENYRRFQEIFSPEKIARLKGEDFYSPGVKGKETLHRFIETRLKIGEHQVNIIPGGVRVGSDQPFKSMQEDPEEVKEMLLVLSDRQKPLSKRLSEAREISKKLRGVGIQIPVKIASAYDPENVLNIFKLEDLEDFADKVGIRKPNNYESLSDAEKYQVLNEKLFEFKNKNTITRKWPTAVFVQMYYAYLKEQGNPAPNGVQGHNIPPLSSYLQSQGLLFPDYLPPAFWNALRTKGFVFLAGLTGTGKTKLATQVAGAMDNIRKSKSNTVEACLKVNIKPLEPPISLSFGWVKEDGAIPIKEWNDILRETCKKEKAKAYWPWVMDYSVLEKYILNEKIVPSLFLFGDGKRGKKVDRFNGVAYVSKFIIPEEKKYANKWLDYFKKMLEQAENMKKRSNSNSSNYDKIIKFLEDKILTKAKNNIKSKDIIILLLEKIEENFLVELDYENALTEEKCENICHVQGVCYSIPQVFSMDQWLGTPTLKVLWLKSLKKSFRFLSVRPDWTDKTELLGWVNPLAGEGKQPRYKRGLVLDFLLDAVKDYRQNKENARPYFLILDEMNLAHIEYYFADFLSVLESGRDEDGWTKEPIRLHEDVEIEDEEDIPEKIYLPPNLYIIGTLNTDETTKSLSPKVLDRGFVLEFRDVDMENYPPEVKGTASGEAPEELRNTLIEDLRNPFEGSHFLSHVGNKELVNPEVKAFKENQTDLWESLKTLNKLLKDHDLHFGYRIIDEIGLFVLAAESSEVAEMEAKEAFDMAVCSKVLPKFYGTRAKLEKALWKVVGWAVNGDSETWEKAYDEEQGAVKSVKSNFIKMASELNEGELVENFLDNTKNESDNNEPNKFLYPHTGLKALRMLRDLYEEGFASYL